MKHTLGILLILLISCNKIKEKTKETINKSGETVGKTATEFIEGVSDGVNKTLLIDLKVSDNLKKMGVQTGKYFLENNPNGGKKNKLIVYLIFDKDFNSKVTAKAYDKNNLEVGRSHLNIIGKSQESGYFEFIFDKRTIIEYKGKVLFE